MKAITHDRYGDPTRLALTEVPDPVPGPGEVLIRVRAASLNPSDWHRVTGTPLIARLESGLWRPKRPIPGTDLAGTIEAVGPGVAPAVVAVGDDVFGWKHGAALAEFAAVSVDQLVPKPENTSFAEAAATGIAAFTALQALRDKAGLQSDHHVLITGAGGGIGSFAVQLAASMGAEVTGVCSAAKADLVRSLGADRVIDYATEDVLGARGAYDVMLDIAGNHRLRDCRAALRPHGTYVLIGGPKGRWLGPIPRLVRALLLSVVSSQRLVPMLSTENSEDLAILAGHLAAGSLRPVIGATVPLADAGTALASLGEGHTTGKTVIVI